MRVVDSVTPGLGGPQVIRRRNGSQGPAHAFRGLIVDGSVRKGTIAEPFESRKAKCDQYFSSTLWGEDRKLTGATR